MNHIYSGSLKVLIYTWSLKSGKWFSFSSIIIIVVIIQHISMTTFPNFSHPKTSSTLTPTLLLKYESPWWHQFAYNEIGMFCYLIIYASSCHNSANCVLRVQCIRMSTIWWSCNRYTCGWGYKMDIAILNYQKSVWVDDDFCMYGCIFCCLG